MTITRTRVVLGTLVVLLLLSSPARPIAPDAASRLPPCHLENAAQESFYPPPAQRQGIEGRVLVEFGLDQHGRPTRVAIVNSDPKGVFETTVVDFLRHAKCLQVLSPSSKDAKPDRYRMGFVFRLHPCKGLACTPIPYEAANGSIAITAS